MVLLLQPPNSPAKDMKDLLARLATMRFSGYEMSQTTSWTEMKYAPGTLKVKKTQGKDSTELELLLDADYLIDDVVELLQGATFNWSQANIDTRELELLDYLLNDPRHVLAHASNVQKIALDAYRVQVAGPIDRKVQASGIAIYVEVHMRGNDISGMDIKKKYDTGIEKLVREVCFY